MRIRLITLIGVHDSLSHHRTQYIALKICSSSLIIKTLAVMRTWNLNLSRVFCIIIPLVSVSEDGVSLLLLTPSWTIKR